MIMFLEKCRVTYLIMGTPLSKDQEFCDHCKGKGFHIYEDGSKHSCYRCNGIGHYDKFKFTEKCPSCNGEGTIKCEHCKDGFMDSISKEKYFKCPYCSGTTKRKCYDPEGEEKE